MEQVVFISHSSIDKPVADAICHHLEEAGIRCWIAPRDINTSDWASSIMEGLHRSEVFVVVISRNSIPSPEVLKEVTEATHTCRYILPFKVDDEMLSDRLRYHLGPCHWLDAVSPPLEARLEELKRRILNLSQDDALYANSRQWRLLERSIRPHSVFVGREAEIDEIGARLQENPVLFLQGMGGIGKSEIAKGYAQQYRDRYDTVIFASYTSNLLELVNSDEIAVENLRRGTAAGADAETPEEFFARKMNIIRSVSSSRTLLIIDNFDVDWDEHLPELTKGPYHLLITSRNEHSDYPTLHIDRVQDFDKVLQIFTANYGRKLDAADLETVKEILTLVGCHTISIELIAKQMKASFVKPAKMLSLLKETGMNTHLREKISHKGGDVKLTSFDYIRQLFQLSGLNEEEKRLLCCMCMIPHSGMDVILFGELCGLEEFDPVNSLLSKSWLTLDEETNILTLHPVVCDVLRDQLDPTPASCKDFIIRFWKWCDNFWYLTREEQQQRAPYLFFLLTRYPEPAPELSLQYADFINLAWICGNFPLSIASGHRYYDFALKTYGPASAEAGTGATFLAGAYHNSGDDESAEPYYRLGLEHRLDYMDLESRFATRDMEQVMPIAMSYSKIGRCEYLRHDFKNAETDLMTAKEIFDRLLGWQEDEAWKNNILRHSGDTVVEIARMHMERGDYHTALEWAQESYDRFFAWQKKEITNSEYSLVDMGICHSHLGNYQKAQEYFQRALELNIVFNGDASIQTLRTREAIADNNMRWGNTEEAKRQYLELELSLEQDFGEQNPQVLRLRKKRLDAYGDSSPTE